MVPDLNDTIVALASPAGGAARAVIRLSGPKAQAIVTSLLSRPFQAQPNQIQAAAMVLPEIPARLPADLYSWIKPRSFTGQNVVEIHTLGSPPLVDQVIVSCLNAGARAAQPGEFTMRAFLGGKLDLTRAEAVLGVIEANSRDELKRSLAQLAGGVARPLQSLREDLLNLLADLEAGLDFSDEDIQFVSLDDLLKRLGKAMAHLINLRRQVEERAVTGTTFRVVLAGPPNAGKSSLFNALIGTAAALVSPQPGTTRDYLEAEVSAEGVTFALIDTAGLGESTAALDQAAQGLSREQADRADLVLLCRPCESGSHGGNSNGAVHKAPAAVQPNLGVADDKILMVGTKGDLGNHPQDMLMTSAVTGAGLGALKKAVAQKLRAQLRPALAPSLSRCRHHLDKALEGMRRAHHLALEEYPPELVALELRLGLEELGALAGTIYTDDLLDRIFSRFCIGK